MVEEAYYGTSRQYNQTSTRDLSHPGDALAPAGYWYGGGTDKNSPFNSDEVRGTQLGANDIMATE